VFLFVLLLLCLGLFSPCLSVVSFFSVVLYIDLSLFNALDILFGNKGRGAAFRYLGWGVLVLAAIAVVEKGNRVVINDMRVAVVACWSW